MFGFENLENDSERKQPVLKSVRQVSSADTRRLDNDGRNVTAMKALGVHPCVILVRMVSFVPGMGIINS